MAHEYYKIRNTKGLFSTGGVHPSWTKKGKTWTNLGHVKTHLQLVKPGIYNGCALVVFELTVTELPGPSLQQLFAEEKEKKTAKQALHDAKVAARQEEYDRFRLAELKKKYEGSK